MKDQPFTRSGEFLVAAPLKSGAALFFLWRDGDLPWWVLAPITVAAVGAYAWIAKQSLHESRLGRHARQSGRSYCPHCRYPLDVAGKTDVTCPECGRTFSSDGVLFHWQGESVPQPPKGDS